MRRFLQPMLAAVLFVLSPSCLFAAETLEADVCIYGGTTGGVVAAVQSARMGKKAIILEPGRHLGGMTAGGLGAVDIGDPRSIGGIAREFFTRLVGVYGKTLDWDQPFKGHGGPATGGAFSIEPKTAEALCETMVREAGATVRKNARLANVRKDGARIVEITTEDGTIVRAKMFIDTTYEGDLMAKAGVSYTVMREGNAKYGEKYNGIHYTDKYLPRRNHGQPGPNGRVPGGQGVWDRDVPIDPYLVPGDPSSGLIPFVQAGEPGTQGEPAPGVQAYCFRLCLTTAADRIPIAPPADYDPARYEIIARFIAGCQSIGDDMDLRWFSKHDPLPNEKWDFNTATFGGNMPGVSWEWPDATYDRRAEIAKMHENYHRGLLHFLATDPRVPEKVRNDMKRFGLPRDEFTDNGGWPHQIYVREARRMISDLVITEHHTFGRQIAPHSVSLGSYGTDTHEIRRIVKDGSVIREGKTAIGRDNFGPYQIGYAAIVPKESECTNLFVTFALSASHTAFSSIRMEPVFMATSQSAATAACQAIDSGRSVQQLDMAVLRSKLLEDKQVIEWNEPPAKEKRNEKSAAAPGREVVAAPAVATIDLSNDASRQVVIAPGTESIYQGHPTTVLLPDGKTMYCVWTYGHGGGCGPLKRSDDGGKSWSDLLAVPDNWKKVRNCPALYRLIDPQGVARLFVFAGQGEDGCMAQSHSLDDGKTWTPMSSNGLQCVMPFCTIVPIDGGKKLLGLTNIRRPGETKDKKSNLIAQSISADGGLTWQPWRIVLDLGQLKPCEPALVRSPDGKQLLCLLRENSRTAGSLFMTSDDDGATWSATKPLPPGLTGDRHMPRYAADGRLVICFRDVGKSSSARNHFVAWIGRYEDILAGRDGEYRLKLLHSHKGSDCGYPGLELTAGGDLFAVTYIKHRPGAEQHSVVGVRFNLGETDPLAKSAGSASREPISNSYDLAVVGATPGGIACAVRAAREGLNVLLVHHHAHLGGFMTSGAGGWEAPYDGMRSPIYAETLAKAGDYYRKTYGEGSKQYRASQPNPSSRGHIDRPKIEPRVAEMIFEQMIAAEPRIAVLRGFYPVAADRQGAKLNAVTFRAMKGDAERKIAAATFVDATYEGDLAAVAKVPYRVGREARSEYNEPHAGVVYTRDRHLPAGQPGFPRDAAEGKLNIRYNPHSDDEVILPESTGEADRFIMAYNYRPILTKNPANRVMVPRPVDADKLRFTTKLSRSIVPNLPNDKIAWNGAGRLIGAQYDYPEADWPTRQKIAKQHLDAGLRSLWIVQNAPDVPKDEREFWKDYGLAKDEFIDNDHLPYEIYVREARRIVGRAIFTEHDGVPAPGIGRTPIHADSVAITDWPLDSVACADRRVRGSKQDGIFFIGEQSRPAQVSYQCLLPQGVDNLLVPVCLSATHVGWGSIRLEPAWMQLGEAAGYAAALAVKENVAPAQLDGDFLQRTLVKNRFMTSFFNDVDVSRADEATIAAQYFGAKGFFADYDARLNEPLSASIAKRWADGLAKLQAGKLEPNELARTIAADATPSSPITEAEFLALLPSLSDGSSRRSAAAISRGQAMAWLYSLRVESP